MGNSIHVLAPLAPAYSGALIEQIDYLPDTVIYDAGVYAINTTYRRGAFVSHEDQAYIARTSVTNVIPPSEAHWFHLTGSTTVNTIVDGGGGGGAGTELTDLQKRILLQFASIADLLLPLTEEESAGVNIGLESSDFTGAASDVTYSSNISATGSLQVDQRLYVRISKTIDTDVGLFLVQAIDDVGGARDFPLTNLQSAGEDANYNYYFYGVASDSFSLIRLGALESLRIRKRQLRISYKGELDGTSSQALSIISAINQLDDQDDNKIDATKIKNLTGGTGITGELAKIQNIPNASERVSAIEIQRVPVFNAVKDTVFWLQSNDRDDAFQASEYVQANTFTFGAGDFLFVAIPENTTNVFSADIRVVRVGTSGNPDVVINTLPIRNHSLFSRNAFIGGVDYFGYFFLSEALGAAAGDKIEIVIPSVSTSYLVDIARRVLGGVSEDSLTEDLRERLPTARDNSYFPLMGKKTINQEEDVNNFSTIQVMGLYDAAEEKDVPAQDPNNRNKVITDLSQNINTDGGTFKGDVVPPSDSSFILPDSIQNATFSSTTVIHNKTSLSLVNEEGLFLSTRIMLSGTGFETPTTVLSLGGITLQVVYNRDRRREVLSFVGAPNAGVEVILGDAIDIVMHVYRQGANVSIMFVLHDRLGIRFMTGTDGSPVPIIDTTIAQLPTNFFKNVTGGIGLNDVTFNSNFISYNNMVIGYADHLNTINNTTLNTIVGQGESPYFGVVAVTGMNIVVGKWLNNDETVTASDGSTTVSYGGEVRTISTFIETVIARNADLRAAIAESRE